MTPTRTLTPVTPHSPYVPSHLISWKDGAGVVEHSTIMSIIGFGVNKFEVRSDRTGLFRAFCLVTPIYDDEGEMISEVYCSDEGTKITVLNT